MCKWFAYGPADGTATPIISCLIKIQIGLAFLPESFWYRLTHKKEAVKQVSVCPSAVICSVFHSPNRPMAHHSYTKSSTTDDCKSLLSSRLLIGLSNNSYTGFPVLMLLSVVISHPFFGRLLFCFHATDHADYTRQKAYSSMSPFQRLSSNHIVTRTADPLLALSLHYNCEKYTYNIIPCT